MSSQDRTLLIFFRLLNNEILIKKDLEIEYSASEKTIQRDMSHIGKTLDFFSTNILEITEDTLPYIDKSTKGQYHLKNNPFQSNITDQAFSDMEILALVHLLVASRALEDRDMLSIVKKCLSLSQNSKQIKSTVLNEIQYYSGIPKDKADDNSLLEKLSLIFKAITEDYLVSFSYTKNFETMYFECKPTGMFFKDLYFFMSSNNHMTIDVADLALLSKFRINNMKKLKLIPRPKEYKGNNNHRERIQTGVLQNSTGQLPFYGKEITLEFDFLYEPAYVIDRFPNSEIIKQEKGVTSFRVQTNDGYGVKMWLLMQGDMIKVKKPKVMIDYLTKQAQNILNFYNQ